MIPIGQLLLTDFTVVKVMISAVITGMVGIEALRSPGLVNLHPETGSAGSTILGGLIFGAGFGILGYCPGTMSGAIGEGRMDALVEGRAASLWARGFSRSCIHVFTGPYSSGEISGN